MQSIRYRVTQVSFADLHIAVRWWSFKFQIHMDGAYSLLTSDVSRVYRLKHPCIHLQQIRFVRITNPFVCLSKLI